MIVLYSGTPGSGKSLDVARVLVERLRQGKPVICNFAFDISKIKRCKGEFVEVSNWNITPRFLMDFSISYQAQHGGVKEEFFTLVLDECGMLFNPRDWNAPNRRDWLEFFSQHRKFKYHIILVAQNDRMIDRQIRGLLEYEYMHRKMTNYGKLGKLTTVFSLGSLFARVEYWYGVKQLVRRHFFRYSKFYAGLYDTYAVFSTEPSAGVGGPAEAPH